MNRTNTLRSVILVSLGLAALLMGFGLEGASNEVSSSPKKEVGPAIVVDSEAHPDTLLSSPLAPSEARGTASAKAASVEWIHLSQLELDPAFHDVLSDTGPATARTLGLLARGLNAIDDVIARAAIGRARPSADLMSTYHQAQKSYYQGLAALTQASENAVAKERVDAYLEALAADPEMSTEEQAELKRAYLLRVAIDN